MTNKQYQYLVKRFQNKLKPKAKRNFAYNEGIEESLRVLFRDYETHTWYKHKSLSVEEYDYLQLELSRRLKTDFSNPAGQYNDAILACKSILKEVRLCYT